MTIRRLTVFTAIFLCVALAAGAQDTKAAVVRETLTIDDLYLSQEVEIQMLRSQAVANNRESKLLALQDIGAMVEDGKITADSKEIVSILDSLAGEGVYKIVTTNGSVSNNFPDVRREAVRLLGKVGGPVAKSTLIKVIGNDKETMVLSEAVYALGMSASDNNAEVLPWVAKVLFDNNAKRSPDDNLAYAALLAIEKISVKQGGVADPDIINAILGVLFGPNNEGSSYKKTVVTKAFSVLSKLRAK